MAELHSNMGEHDRKLEKAIEKSLRLVGGLAERKAKELISELEAVDTGFLRNSITWAIDGDSVNMPEYQDDSGKQTGVYEGEAPSEHGDQRAVYIGTNVYYAPYVEYGTRRMGARPFLSGAIQGNADEFKDMFEEAFKHFSN